VKPAIIPENGTLYLVSTPIGNLADMSRRAIDVLTAVHLIAAEDTRHSKTLLRNYGVATRTTSYHDFNKERKTRALIADLCQGRDVALISDAGTPGISDPAYRLVRQCIDGGIRVEAIPGPTAFVPALVLSGLPTDRFVFEGFLPARKGRRKRLDDLVDEIRTIILYESPHRIHRTIEDLITVLGDRDVALARELTKKFEEILRGNLTDVRNQISGRRLKGELVLVVAGKGK
jgi:16S rRNA (cytidine1402-2'-O)-methyltransferase